MPASPSLDFPFISQARSFATCSSASHMSCSITRREKTNIGFAAACFFTHTRYYTTGIDNMHSFFITNVYFLKLFIFFLSHLFFLCVTISWQTGQMTVFFTFLCNNGKLTLNLLCEVFSMNIKSKKITSVFLCFLLIMSLCSCGKNYEKKYQEYVKSLIAINYLGVSDEYIKSTGAKKEDADALYEANANLLANNILTYYGITISDASEMMDKYVDLAKNIYGKVNYKVSPARKDGSVYLVDVTIYPINLFAQSSADVAAYVNKFNEGVANGIYNDYTMAQYETEFSTGMIDILNEAATNMTYADPVTVTVEIVVDGDTYYISERDFLRIDAAMINTTDVTIPEATPEDAQ